MEPVTLALIAGFMLPPAPTRSVDWLTVLSRPATNTAPDTDILIDASADWSAANPEGGTVIANAQVMPNRLEALRIELSLYGGLSQGWDGPDTHAPSAEDISDALVLLSKMPSGIPVPKPMLGSSGTLGLYWDNDKVFADIEFEGDGCISLFTRQKQNDMHEALYEDVSIADLTSEWLTEKLASLTLS